MKMKNRFKKIIGILLIVGLNWSAISLIAGTDAYFNDVEKSENNTLTAGILDFYLEGEGFHAYGLQQTQNEIIEMINNENNLEFKYSVFTDITDGDIDFCDNLNLSVYLNNGMAPIYNNFLKDFNLFNILAPYSGDSDKWDFKITSGNSSGICEFDFVFQAQQENLNYGKGFFDEEKISNVVSTLADCGVANYIVINEVQIAGATATDEFVELYNPTNAKIDISGWKLQYKSDTGDTWSSKVGDGLPSNSKIEPYSFFLLASKSYDGDISPNYIHNANWGLGNTAGHIRIIDNNDNQIDKVGYGSTANSPETSPAPNPSANQSIERGLAGYDSDDNSKDFIIKENPTQTNSNKDGMSEIVINEFLATGENFDDFVEIYNNSDNDISVGGWTIKIESDGFTHISYLSEGEIRSKDWFLIRYADKDILQKDGVITIYNDSDIEINKISYYNATMSDSSFARIPDGSPNWVDPIPTPGRENVTPENLALAGLAEEEEIEETIEEAPVVEKTTTKEEVEIPAVEEIAEETTEETDDEIPVVKEETDKETPVVEEEETEKTVEEAVEEKAEEIETTEEIIEEVSAVEEEAGEEASEETTEETAEIPAEGIEETVTEETGEKAVEIPVLEAVEEIVEEIPVVGEEITEKTAKEAVDVEEEMAEEIVEEATVVEAVEEIVEEIPVGEETAEETTEEIPVVEEEIVIKNDTNLIIEIIEGTGSPDEPDNE
ncbi:MAG: lamin tail domain-containing protein [Patescibacteria group bacterium]|nr:lamin tail domain-containing protein [Patescibacteria group bacterium]